MELRSISDKNLIAAYLFAAVTANLLVAAFGQSALIVTSVFLIPFDLVARDVLHERWHDDLALRMALLIAAGSMLSAIANISAWRVALASFVSFAFAGASDHIVYAECRGLRKLDKMTLSNAVSASVDSLVFPLVAFGSIDLWLSLAQAAAKVAGGIAWTALFLWRRHV